MASSSSSSKDPNATDPPRPSPAYFPTSSSSPLHPPAELYARLRSLTAESGALIPTASFEIPARSGRAWKVPKGSIFRLSTPAGPQVGDLNVWNAHDPRERFWAARTRQLQGSHVREGDRLWSCLPFMRPLCGMIRDGCLVEDAEGGRAVGRDERGAFTRWGGRCHDLLGTRCDPYVNNMLSGTDYDYHCHSNLVRAVLPHGLTEFDVHDVLNVFQVTGLDEQGRYFMEASPAKPTSYIDFFAEQDLLCALSTCPGGDLSAWGWHQADDDGGNKPDMKATCRPIKVEVWELSETAKKDVLADWKEPERSGYRGMHGMGIPTGEASTIPSFAPLLEKRAMLEDPSRVIVTGSMAGIGVGSLGEIGAYSYAASKAAVHHLARNLAVELGPRHFLVNSIAPGIFPSKLAKVLMENGGGSDRLGKVNPSGRLGRAEDIAAVVVYLSSRAGGHVNGDALGLDGGSMLGSSRLEKL
ncbi:hypothetical protein BS50DRAFT_670709 [Corynespora cassiicola Philippines]|uniref:DUF1989 domain-containing protein n=1 Tax=Corynespora cassiicola Philippines TaxID=1448308 RepID=A0A2T2P9E6_CORCC|nr:hypothetical protein BS50DRAFT_670709 [Corynespora cassiicola Philippines]